MASLLFVNTVHICFDSVLAMDNQGMVAMFESLVATGLKGFLGCPAVLHEAALLEFFENGSVRDGLVVSTVNGVSVEISEQLLAETFELPVEGLSDLSEISKDLVVDARSIISLTDEPVSMSVKKKEMKIEFCLLCDIMAKTISVKAGSFDAITQEKFLMMAGITCGVQVNWNKILFNILKDMVTAETRKARGYAIQISILLENFPNLELGESTEFPSSNILTEKTVHRYIILNEKFGGEDVTDAPRVKRTHVKRAISKTKSAAVDTEAAPIVKKKSTTQSKPVSSKDTLVTLPVEAVPLQMIAPTTAALTEQLPVPKRPTQKRERRLILGSDDEIADISEPTVAEDVNEGPSTTDDVDDIIQQVLTETAQIGADKEEIDGGGETVSGSAVGSQAVDKVDEFEQWLNLSYEEFHARQADRLVETASDIEDEMESDMGNQVLPVVGGTNVVLGTNVGVQIEASPDEHLVKESMEAIKEKLVSADEAMSLEDILMSIPVDVPLPSTGVEVTKITLGKSIKIPGVDERTWYMASLPQIPMDDKGKKPLWRKTQLRVELLGHKDGVNKIKETISLHIHDLERKLTDRFDAHDRTYRVIFNNIHHDMRHHKNLLSLDLKTYQQKVSNQVGAAAFDVVDVMRVVKELDAKVAAVATGLDDVRKDVEATKEAISHQILDFCAQAQENYNILTAQLSELVAYVNRGGNDKKKEDSSSRGPQPPPDDQDRPTGEGSANREAGIRGGVVGTEVEVVLVELKIEETGVNLQKEGDLVMSRRFVVIDMVHIHQLAYPKEV
ncbi:hypothetical protein F511_24714 [Dorcoceras hygrometricum]|uniref:Dystroglycan-like n=1 Tax=Dorcoceras hygrometricum TaxID=472368 RepID=A0A2Z7CR61_9LAMI|nr:hypothetical protein F511_24714 [Dorcoceras hygrometricum]